MIDLRKLLLEGHAARSAEKAESEAKQKNTYRIGTSGCVTADGDVYGTCHRIALSRFLGIEPEPELKDRVMWLAGEYNEEATKELLTKSSWKGLVAAHDDLLVDVKIEALENPLRGHPDLGLVTIDGKRELVIELKGVFGASTAVLAFLERKPKPDNIVQSAQYSKHLNVPYALMYTNPNWMPVNYYVQKQHGVKHVLPGYSIFYLDWRDDTLWYRHEDETEWVKTVITKDGLDDYYRLIQEMRQQKDLGPLPTGNYADGSKPKWSPCGLCEFKTACENYDGNHKNFDKWIEDITTICEGESS